MKAINYTAKVLPDAIIAATANEYELILATANEKHFKIFQETNIEVNVK